MSQKRSLGVPGSGARASAIVNAAFASRFLANAVGLVVKNGKKTNNSINKLERQLFDFFHFSSFFL